MPRRLLGTHKWEGLTRSPELPKMRCRQAYASTFRASVVVLRRQGKKMIGLIRLCIEINPLSYDLFYGYIP